MNNEYLKIKTGLKLFYGGFRYRKITNFNSEFIINIINYIKNHTIIPINPPRSGKTYKNKLLIDRESLLFQLLAVQSEIERLDNL